MSFLPGFDPRWSSVEDYILGITEDIWERRQIDSLTRYYADGLIVRSPASVVVGNDGIIAATMATLAEFPDRQLPGEDVIWCATGADSFL
ncbi:MAG: nuclear transport factor 2 family protein, partial [Pseudomonadota bacterium]